MTRCVKSEAISVRPKNKKLVQVPAWLSDRSHLDLFCFFFKLGPDGGLDGRHCQTG